MHQKKKTCVKKNKLSHSSYTIETLETKDVEHTLEKVKFWEINNFNDVYRRSCFFKRLHGFLYE